MLETLVDIFNPQLAHLILCKSIKTVGNSTLCMDYDSVTHRVDIECSREGYYAFEAIDSLCAMANAPPILYVKAWILLTGRCSTNGEYWQSESIVDDSDLEDFLDGWPVHKTVMYSGLFQVSSLFFLIPPVTPTVTYISVTRYKCPTGSLHRWVNADQAGKSKLLKRKRKELSMLLRSTNIAENLLVC